MPVLLAVAVGAGVERLTGVPTVVAGLVALTAALVASPRLLAVVQPAADVLLRLLPALFVPLVAGVAGVGGDVRSAWPAAVAAIAVSVPAGFLVTVRLAGGPAARTTRDAGPAGLAVVAAVAGVAGVLGLSRAVVPAGPAWVFGLTGVRGVAGVAGVAVAVAGTLVVYAVADAVSARLGGPALANPVAWGAVAALVALAVASVPVDDYVDAARPLRWVLAPATVALAAPLAREARMLAAGGWRPVASVAVGGAVASGVGAGVAVLLGAPATLVEAVAAKSVTTPIAVAIIPGRASDSLVATTVIAAGVFGAVMLPPLARRLRVDEPAPLGLGVGVVSHAIGTAELAKRDPRSVGYGVAGLVLNGVITALWLPPLLRAL